ncbi:MAG: aromatic ring-hydroxylating dioxygenase subunit alpha [Novosphingobium sp.]|nr:aromatic ring-hydroxylating dioxygenase subunit alpha [Novosphingobium sp.]
MNVFSKTSQDAWSDDDLLALGTDPIPAAPYYDPEVFELERKAVFMRSWTLLGHICELPEPGDYIVREVEFANASILISHGKDGQLRAFHNVCPHRGTKLVADDGGNASAFTCRYHAWSFGSDGALRSAPDFERFYVEKADCGLRKVSLQTCGGLIFIHFGEAPEQDLQNFLGEATEKLKPLEGATRYSEFTYDIDANWKVVLDNFQENYHLRFVHATAPNAVGPDNPFGYPVAYRFFGPHRTQTLWVNPERGMPKPVELKAYMSAGAEAADSDFPDCDMKLFPNLHIVSHGGFYFVQRIMPLSAGRSRCIFRLYWVGDECNASSRFSREYVFAMVRDVITEDRSIVMAVQEGIQSGALDHIHFQEHEIMCRHLYHMVQNMVDAYLAEEAAA